MPQAVVPMIQVPDVRATLEWYVGIGFTVVGTNEDDGELNWTKISYGNSDVMFQAGGRPSAEHRREVDLYIRVANVDELYEQLKRRFPMVVELNDTFYGMREFTLRDLNRFWITFGQPLQN